MTRVFHHRWRPLFVGTILTLAGCAVDSGIAFEPVARVSPGDIEVFSGSGPNGGSIYSVIRDEEGAEIEHGLRVTTDHGWLREATVHDNGVLIRHFQFHRNGYPFIMKYLDGNGDGFVQIWSSEGRVVFEGHVRAGLPRRGEFMAPEFIPNTYGERRIRLLEYRDGEIVRREPFPFHRIGVEPPDHPVDPTNWPWKWGDWPAMATQPPPPADDSE